MNKKNYGIELLRIIAMCMVVLLHLIRKGGLINMLPISSNIYRVFLLLELICFSSVNIFAIITGYVLYNKKYNLKRIIALWLEIVFYSTIIYLIYGIINNNYNINYLIKSITPILSNNYWYFTQYFCLICFLPYLNKFIELLEYKEYTRLLLMFFIIFNIIQTIIGSEIFITNNGYSFIWLMIMYFVGAYINKFDILKKISFKKCLICLIITIIISFVITAILNVKPLLIFIGYIDSYNIMRYTSPFTVLISIFIFILISKINISKNKILLFLSKSAFSVFLIHAHTLVYNSIIKDMFLKYISVKPIELILLAIIITIIIYVSCVIIDYVRIKIFELLRINKLIEYFSKTIENIINKEQTNNYKSRCIICKK